MALIAPLHPVLARVIEIQPHTFRGNFRIPILGTTTTKLPTSLLQKRCYSR